MNEVGYKEFRFFHHHAAKEVIANQPSVDSGGPLGGMISGEVTLELPWRELLSNGLVQGGFARLVTSLEMLVVGRQINALRVGMDVFGQDIWHYVSGWFKEWVRENDPDSTAHLYLQRPDFLEDLKQKKPVAEAFAMAYAEQDLDTFNDCFRRYVSRNNYYGAPASTGHPPFFLGRQLSFCFLDAANDGSEVFQEFHIKVAQQSEMGSGAELLEELASRTTNPFVLCKLADIWAKQGEKDIALELLERAEAGTDAGRLIVYPWARWQIFGDQDAARGYMEGCIDSPSWSQDCEQLHIAGIIDFSKLYEDVGGAEPYLTHIYSAAESCAVNVGDWAEVIQRYQISGRADDASRCLLLAAETPKSCQDWNHMALLVRVESDDEGLFRQYMGQAESLAQTSEDWRICAESWDDPLFLEEAARCGIWANDLEGEK